MSNDYYFRLKDEFFLAAQVRPATAEHYVSWLEAHLDNGGKVDHLVQTRFSEAKFFTMSANATVPQLEGELAVSIIVPPGIKADVDRAGDCRVYFVDGAAKNRKASAPVWPEMLDMLIGDGYKMSQLVDQYELRALIQDAIVDRVTCGQARGREFYQAFSGLSFSTVDAGLTELRALPAENLLRDILKLKPETAIDAETQKILDQQKQDALKVLEVLHYKLNPAHQEPIAVFGKRAKHLFPEEPNAELSGELQVSPPLKYRGPGPQG